MIPSKLQRQRTLSNSQKNLLNGLDSYASEAVCIIVGMIIPSLWLILGCLEDTQQPLSCVLAQMFITLCEEKQPTRQTKPSPQKKRIISQWWSWWYVAHYKWEKHFIVNYSLSFCMNHFLSHSKLLQAGKPDNSSNTTNALTHAMAQKPTNKKCKSNTVYALPFSWSV